MFSYLRASLDGFDRLFEHRELELLGGPEMRGDGVWLAWRATYRTQGLPELVVDGEESVRFSGDRIERLEDRFELAMSGLVERWFELYGEKLAGSA